MKTKFKSWVGKEIPRKNTKRVAELKKSAIRNVVTSDFEIKEGLKIAFEQGYNEGKEDLKVRVKKEIEQIINKINSNWYYCEKKSQYGNDIIDFIKEIVDTLNNFKEKMRLKKLKISIPFMKIN